MSIDELFEQAEGEWEGEYRLWMRPSDEPDARSATSAHVTRELGGRSLLLHYDWQYGEDVHLGLAIITRTDDGGISMGWSDTFHAKDGVMHNAAVGTDSKVLARYGPEDAPWGWRTEFDLPAPDELVIRAFNITPDGTEALATEARYARVG